MDKDRVFLRWLRSRGGSIAAFFVVAALFALSFYLYRLPLGAVLYPTALCVAFGILLLVLDWLRTVRRHRIWLRLQKPAAVRQAELPPPQTVEGADAAAVIACLRRGMTEQEDAAHARYCDMMEYYTLWAHQIKTPLAAMRLTLAGEDNPTSRTLALELARTERYVDMVMTYLRLDAAGCDYVFRRTELDPLVRAAVKRFSGEFIAKHLSVEITGTGITAVTDEKWISFVLEQLLSNALKYTQSGGIRIFSPAAGKLSIADSGIGIAPEDLPRIFERGYTGGSGRTDAHSSGIGLYLCRRVCDALSVGISLTSCIGRGTTVTLDLSQKEMHAE